jgi:hypothetical protein
LGEELVVLLVDLNKSREQIFVNLVILLNLGHYWRIDSMVGLSLRRGAGGEVLIDVWNRVGA